ncbi:MAG: [NiFe]-hydrogenase assembly chaperone HybE [Kiloniellales bacterium]|nr:[NiFe]-hydrogenase assembly chaperone HybE [Kiloniellales bacterium]
MNPFEDDVGIAKLEKRLGLLLRQFKTLAPGMTDLPLYNHNVGIEAVDFMPFGGMGFGALVTPWFINAVFLPLEPVSYNPDQVGKTATVELPAGQRGFTLGGDEPVGLYWSHCIMSPLTQIVSHDAALVLARARLAELLTRPEADEGTEARPIVRSRRDLLISNLEEPALG